MKRRVNKKTTLAWTANNGGDCESENDIGLEGESDHTGFENLQEVEEYFGPINTDRKEVVNFPQASITEDGEFGNLEEMEDLEA